MSVVLDSSAVLALLWDEPGGDLVAEHLDGAVMSTVNYAEVLTKIIDRGIDEKRAKLFLASLAIETITFDKFQAETSSQLRSQTRQLGLSLGDRACLALAMSKGWPALSADKAWAELKNGTVVRLVR
ncbi:MAG: type II toxin-antitoxin system VapC family toxin [Alphaproteobacteria bacterium]|nr:type II toxin-antitoxin system VapC family toxin [Alphaproteobacteria bacterium]